MYILNENKIEGKIQVREHGEIKAIERKILYDILEIESHKEKNEVRNHDYNVLREGIMGIEALLLEKNIISVVYKQKAMWRREGEGRIIDNDRLIRVLKKAFRNYSCSLRMKGVL